MKTSILSVVTFLLFVHLRLAAQELAAPRWRESGVPYMQSFTSQDYHAYVQHWSIVQDERGIMYFATNDGVLEFDGVSWRLIQTEHQSIVRCVAITTRGRVCVGALNEIGFLAPDSSGSMRYVSLLSHVDSANREFGSLRSLVSTSKGMFFLSRSHLFRWNGSKVELHVWKSRTSFTGAFAVENRLYVQQEHLGLMTLEQDSLRQCSHAEIVADKRIYFMLPSYSISKNEILLGTRQGLFKYNGDSLWRFQTDADRLLSEYRVQHGAYLPDGSLALATERRGVVIMNREGSVQQILDKSSGLRDVHVKFIYVDRQGGMWLALNNSIARYEVSSASTMFRGTPGMENGVVGLTRHNGVLYASTGLGIYFLQPANSPGELPAFKPVRGITAQCGPLLSVGGILLAGTGDGIYRINGDKSQLLRQGSADCLYASPRDSSHVYIGFYDGLGLMRVANGAIEYLGKAPGINGQVRTIIEDSDGTVWMGMPYQGVFSVRGLSWNSSLRASQPDLHRYTAGVDFHFSSINPLPVKGRLLFTTSAGLRRFEPTRQAFVPDSMFGGSFADSSSSFENLVTDKRGNIWMQRFSGGRLEFGKLAARSNGAYEWEPHAIAGGSSFGPVWAMHIDREDDVIWLGGTDGVLRYDARQSNLPKAKYVTLLRRVTTKDDSLVFGGSAVDELSPPKIPSLTYEYNSLRFDYAALSYNGLTENLYQYYLEGFDAAWSEWNNESKKEYTNLPAGRFAFHVKSRNVHGAIGKEAVYSFSILPPFWETWWFRSMVVLLFLSVGPFIYFRRVRQLKRAQQRQQQFSRQLMESQENERKRIAGELHDSIGQSLLVIKNRAVLGVQNVSDTTKVKKQFDEISSTVTEALGEVRYIAHNLHPYQLENIGLAAALRSMLTKIAESTPIRISGEIGDIDGMVLPKNEINVYRIIQEAMNNVLKHSEASEATVTVAVESSALVIKVQDNGKGFVPNEEKKFGGMGVKGIAERVNILNGSYAIDSSPGKGTMVEVRVPVETMS